MELIAAGRLTLTNAEDLGLFGLWKSNVALLAPGPGHRASRSSNRSLTALLDLIDETSPHMARDGSTGVPVAELARRARREYGRLVDYAHGEVMPGLASRGLYELREQPVSLVKTSR